MRAPALLFFLEECGAQTELDFAYRRHTDLFVLYRDRPQVFTNRHAVESIQGNVRRRENLAGGLRLHYGLETYADSIDSNNLGSHSRIREAGYVALEGVWRKRGDVPSLRVKLLAPRTMSGAPSELQTGAQKLSARNASEPGM